MSPISYRAETSTSPVVLVTRHPCSQRLTELKLNHCYFFRGVFLVQHALRPYISIARVVFLSAVQTPASYLRPFPKLRGGRYYVIYMSGGGLDMSYMNQNHAPSASWHTLWWAPFQQAATACSGQAITRRTKNHSLSVPICDRF